MLLGRDFQTEQHFQPIALIPRYEAIARERPKLQMVARIIFCLPTVRQYSRDRGQRRPVIVRSGAIVHLAPSICRTCKERASICGSRLGSVGGGRCRRRGSGPERCGQAGFEQCLPALPAWHGASYSVRARAGERGRSGQDRLYHGAAVRTEPAALLISGPGANPSGV